ncbi:MAG: acyl-CoA dehydrogenase family protein [Bacteroidia bacterium]|nr:acyl-CoA dehydrogenase family protein [Bacteroidia bacterium]
MSVAMTNLLKGGEFLVKDTAATDVFVPEEFNSEQRSLADMCGDFLVHEVYPYIEALDKMDNPKLMPELVTKAGNQGLLGISIPTEYGGYGMDFITAMLTTEVLGAGHSFSVALAAHTGIGTLPILYFGNDAQKAKYLPKLASGEWKASYCLTEPGSGSDALGAKTKAVLSDDGKHYIINGQKMWITNAGFADVFVVFAKINGEQFTGFIVEKGTPGLSLGEEEKKMGIKGSSTRQVFFNDMKIPVENLLGEAGKGHLIAFNILNIGRIKLAAAVLGGAKKAASVSAQYAIERHQFNTSISKFGAVQYKLAEQAIRIFALETATYRASNDLRLTEEQNLAAGMSTNDALLKAAEEFSVECAMLKVFGSEVIDYVVDEGVQIYGGMGFSAEAPMDRAYRDARINRIFEGTNEINRLLTVDMLLKKAMKGKLDLMTPAMAVQKELMSVPDFSTPDDSIVFGREKKLIKNLKKAALMVAGAAVQKFMQKLAHEQEILMNIADMCIETYVCESFMLRVEKLKTTNPASETNAVLEQMFLTYLNDAADRVFIAGKNACNAFATGDELRVMLMGMKRFTKSEPFNTKDARRQIAQAVIAAGKYPF